MTIEAFHPVGRFESVITGPMYVFLLLSKEVVLSGAEISTFR
jgi:hypothetical protein